MTAERALPVSLEAERLLIGSILFFDSALSDVRSALVAEDFSLEFHRRIFKRSCDVQDAGNRVDPVSVFSEMQRHRETDNDTFGKMAAMEDGLPRLPNLDNYLRLVQDCAVLRRLIFQSQKVIDECFLSVDTPAQILSRSQAALSSALAGRESHGKWFNPGQVMEAYPGGITGFLQPRNGGDGIPTPWSSLTETLCGFQEQDLVILAGRPSMGKSVAAMQICHKAAKDTHGAAVFSLEMSKEALVKRLACSVASVDFHRFQANCLGKDERYRMNQAVNEIYDLPLWIDDTRARTIPAITSALRKLIAEHPVKVLAIDHLQLMRSSGPLENRHQELSEVCHSLKVLAGEFKLTLLLCSQLNRECEKDNRRPQLSDLKETGSIEEDADVVILIHRWERYEKFRGNQEHRGTAEFIIPKQRQGKTGMLRMTFLDNFQRFEMATGTEGLDQPED